MSTESLPSTQPYFLRALHEWCTDNGFTPYLAVKVDGSVQVPPEFVRNGEIVLNLSYDATAHLQIGNDYVEFEARFGGVPRKIVVPVHRVMAIYARENGQGMAFNVTDTVLISTPEMQESQEEQLSAQSEAPFTDESENNVIAELPKEGKGASKAKTRQQTTLKSVESDAALSEPEEPPPTPAGGDKRPTLRRVK